MLNYIYVLHNISIKQHWFRVLVKEEITDQKMNKSTSSGPGISDRVAISTPSTILVSNITALGEMAGAETIQDELQQLVIPETKVVKYTTGTYKRDTGAD